MAMQDLQMHLPLQIQSQGETLVTMFRTLHEEFCQLGWNSDPRVLLPLRERFRKLCEAVNLPFKQNASRQDLAAVRRYVHNIHILARAAVQCHAVTQSFQSKLVDSTAALLAKPALNTLSTCSDDEYRPWKDWFVENMDNPYATDREAAALAALIPGQNAQQFRTWLTNNRRRSGWYTLFKEHAESSKDRMRLLMSQYEDEHLSQLMPPEMYDAITEVKNYHKKLDEGRSLSGEIKKVVEEHGQITPLKKRRVRASTSGSENEGSPPQSCASVSLRSSSGSSTSSPYFFESAATPAPVTGKRSREEETDHADSPSSSKRSKSSLYDMPNRPIASLRTQQPADLFTFQPQPVFASLDSSALQEYNNLTYSLPSISLTTNLPEIPTQPIFPTFSLPPIAVPDLPWLNEGNVTLAEQSFNITNLLELEPLSGVLEPWPTSSEV